MSIEDLIIEKFAPLFGGRLWWDETKDGMTAEDRKPPFAVVQQVGGADRQYVDDREEPKFLTARLQFSLWGANRIAVSAAMRNLCSLARASNVDANWYMRLSGEAVHDSNEILKLRGSRQDFIVTYRNPNYSEL